MVSAVVAIAKENLRNMFLGKKAQLCLIPIRAISKESLAMSFRVNHVNEFNFE